MTKKKRETSISEQETARATTQFQLFQSMGDFFWKALHYDYEATKEQIHKAFYGGHYAWVHTFALEDEEDEELEDQLQTVFHKSQNLEESWRGEIECRSTSVGDVIKVGNQYWIVAARGFDLGWEEKS